MTSEGKVTERLPLRAKGFYGDCIGVTNPTFTLETLSEISRLIGPTYLTYYAPLLFSSLDSKNDGGDASRRRRRDGGRRGNINLVGQENPDGGGTEVVFLASGFAGDTPALEE